MSTPVASSVSMDTPSDAAAPLLSPAAALKLNCSDAEREAITAFRARVADVLPHASARWSSDSTLLRFLRARKLNFEAAEAMYRDVIAWRREVRADHILNPTEYTEPEAMKGYFATGIHGVDLDGHAVLVERVGVLYVRWFSGCHDIVRSVRFTVTVVVFISET